MVRVCSKKTDRGVVNMIPTTELFCLRARFYRGQVFVDHCLSWDALLFTMITGLKASVVTVRIHSNPKDKTDSYRN